MKKILSSPKFLIPTTIIAIFYTLSVVYLMNFRLVGDTIIGDFPLGYKITLLVNLLGGMWTAMSGLGLLILIATAILTGANLTLITQRISSLRNQKNLHFAVGSSTILGIIGSGCAACGLPILALLGLSGSIIYLPMRGTELAYLAVVLLFISLYFMLRKENNAQSCKLNLSKV